MVEFTNGFKASSFMHFQQYTESEQGLSFVDLESTEEDRLMRPWKRFWPPSKGGKVWDWLTLTHPDALKWRYNRQSTLIDRPWRQWTRQAIHVEELEAQTTHRSANSDQANTSPPSTSLNPDGAESGPTENENENENKSQGRTHKITVTATVTTTAVIDAGSDSLAGAQVQANIRHLVPLPEYQNEKPYLSRLPHIEGLKRTNIVDQEYMVTLSNIQGKEHDFDLDTAGFEYRLLPFTISTWNDRNVVQQYLPFVRDHLAKAISCDDVIIYAFSFRGPTGAPQGDGPWKRPFFRAHCDATSRSCVRRLQLLNKTKVVSKTQRIRVWRPITGPLHDYPLAMCDARTLLDGDLVPADVIFPHYCDEGFEVLRRDSHRWVYKNPMSCDEVIIFKLDDTSPSAIKHCPHSAFKDPTVPHSIPSRASIEVRAIIIGD